MPVPNPIRQTFENLLDPPRLRFTLTDDSGKSVTVEYTLPLADETGRTFLYMACARPWPADLPLPHVDTLT